LFELGTTTPVAAGYYSNGVNHWYIASPGSGLLSAQTICPAPTPTPTPTSTPTPTATPVPPTETPTPTPTSTPTPSCQCYRVNNPTDTGLYVTYTPCGTSETSVLIPAYNALNMCVEPSTIITRDSGLDYPIFCGITCLYDGVDCSGCA
jgi:hypothetical protein